MRRVLLAIATLGACSSPHAAAVRSGPATTTTSTTWSTTTTTAVPSTTTTSTTELLPPPSTIAVPASPPLNPPELEDLPARSTGVGGTTSASWYGAESGAYTANGDRYDPGGLTFAHRTMAFGTAVRFCRVGACVVATCTDRGPATWTGRDFDLSKATFAQLAPLSAGVATISWERLG